MKKITALCMLCLIGITLSSCKDDTEDELAANTWTLEPEGIAKGSYRTKSITLSTQIYQLVEATSLDNEYGGIVGINSTLRLYFSTVGPPPTGTYSVTSVDKVSGNANSVAIYLQTFGDPSTGISGTYWYSPENSGQTISFTFADGKVSAAFNDVVIKQTGTGPQTGKLSANISQ